jgi:ubiquinone biosynthesis accessory factor UbiJ
LNETASSAKATPAVAFCFLLNQLLARETWARGRLERFVGQSAEFRPPLLPPLRVAIAAGGTIEPGGDEPSASVTLQGIVGEGALADELRYLAEHLRWDFEEELARVMGDVAAERVGSTLRSLVRWQADAAERVTQAFADYAFVRADELERFATDVERLRAAIGELERRLV